MPIFIVFIALLLITFIFFLILSKIEKEKIQIFHVMAHKLRSHISTIKWHTELLLDKSVGTLNDKQKKYFNEIFKSAELLNDIVSSLTPKQR